MKSITDLRVLRFVASTEAKYSSTELNLGRLGEPGWGLILRDVVLLDIALRSVVLLDIVLRDNVLPDVVLRHRVFTTRRFTAFAPP
jgi:hypothetical protein